MSRTAAALAAVVALALVPGQALAATPRASLTDIETDVMCTACHEPLAVSQSPEANSERDYINGLIAKGETKSQILKALVAQYGESVLAKPPARGFNLTVYVLPPAVLLIGGLAIAFTLPRWRRRTRAAAAAAPLAAGSPPLTKADAQRLDDDLATFKG
jgi:cytochrome c-type biogenesis protein CcmH